MRVGSKKLSDVREKLISLAYGDADLVQSAFWAAAKDRSGPAALKDVVHFIIAHRKQKLAA